ncbi:hypothetical protein ACHAWF_002924 [Thalassiosira exigua]
MAIRFIPRRLLLSIVLGAALSAPASASELAARSLRDEGLCSPPPGGEDPPPGDDGTAPDVCMTPPDPPAQCKLDDGRTMSFESSVGGMCGDGDGMDYGGRLLLRGGNNVVMQPTHEGGFLDEGGKEVHGRELGWGDWSDADSWIWYFCGGGVNVPLTATGWEPEIYALWMKRHGKQMLKDICAGVKAKKYSIGRWDSIWNLGVTWIGGFSLQMKSVYLKTIKTSDGKCYKVYAVTVTFNDHFDCDPGGGNTYFVKHTWNFRAYCPTPCPTTTTTTTTTTSATTKPPNTPTLGTASSSTTSSTKNSTLPTEVKKVENRFHE